MKTVLFRPLRNTLFAAMGMAACSDTVTVIQGPSTSGSGAGTTTATTTGQTTVSVGVGGGPSVVCAGAEPVLAANGTDSGFARCPDGTIHRVFPQTCGVEVDAPACDPSADQLNCMTDADCTDRPYGRCSLFTSDSFGSEFTSCGCVYPCTGDADCEGDTVCVCDGVAENGPGWSFCAFADCASGDDCASGECGLSEYNDGCGFQHSLACRAPTDTCRVDADCDDNLQCVTANDPNGAWGCRGEGCAIGRPLLVAGSVRTAELARGTTWLTDGCRPDVASLDPTLRGALADHWSAVAQLEHASVASFARFILQLLAVGAPSDLVREAQAAMADEIDHAEIAFTLASAYAGEDVTAGPLNTTGAEAACDLAAMLVALVEEACVGETVGVAEALWSAEQVADPVVRAALTRIATDEERHAALAWRTLRWGLQQVDEATRSEVRAAMRRAMNALRADPAIERASAPRHGLLGAAELGAVRRQAIRDVVEPCAEAAFA